MIVFSDIGSGVPVVVPECKSEMGRSQKAGEVNVLPEARRKDDVMKIKGMLNVWFVDRNYGFIHQEKGGAVLKHFLHGANITSGTPRTGATVSFKSVVGSRGFLAVDAEILGGAE